MPSQIYRKFSHVAKCQFFLIWFLILRSFLTFACLMELVCDTWYYAAISPARSAYVLSSSSKTYELANRTQPSLQALNKRYVS
jgi:hypothetical protein